MISKQKEESRIQNPESKIQNPESRIQNQRKKKKKTYMITRSSKLKADRSDGIPVHIPPESWNNHLELGSVNLLGNDLSEVVHQRRQEVTFIQFILFVLFDLAFDVDGMIRLD